MLRASRVSLIAACATLFSLCGACAERRPDLLPLLETPISLAAPTLIALEGPSRPVVKVRLDGDVEALFLVDSGAETTVIGESDAKQLDLPLWDYAWASSINGSGAGSTSYDQYAHISSLQLGELELREFRITALKDPVLASLGVAGILGQDLLGRLPVVFDAERHELHLLPPESGQAEIERYLADAELGLGTWRVQPAAYRPRPFLPLGAPGLDDGTLEVLIDTGADSCSFPPVFLDTLGLEAKRSSSFAGIGGNYEAQLYQLDDFDLLGFAVSSEVHRTPLDHAVLGMNVLGEFVFVLDAPSERFWLHHRTVEPKRDDG